MIMQPQVQKRNSSNTSIVTIVSIGLLLIGSLIAISIHQSRSTSTVRTIPQPMIGGNESKHQGPWPECVNMTSSDCVKYIETYAEDLRTSHKFQIIEPDMMVTMDFIPSRVRIYVNESDIVIQIPRRG